MRAALCHLILLALLQTITLTAASAQNPFDQIWSLFSKGPAAPPSQPDGAKPQREPRLEAKTRPVETSDLPPLKAPDATGLPLDLWRGLDLATLERLLATVDAPPRSPGLHQLWRRALLTSATPPAGGREPDQFLALRLDALYRSGLLHDLVELTDQAGPLGQLQRARRDIGVGTRDAACVTLKALTGSRVQLQPKLKGELQLLVSYCAAAAGDLAGATLAASIAREEGAAAESAFEVLGRLEGGAKRPVGLPSRIGMVSYRFLELLGPVGGGDIVEKAEPALLVALSASSSGDVKRQTAAAEAALRLNALTPEAVAEVYRRQPEPAPRTGSTPREHTDPVLRRASLFRAIEATQAPDPRARLMRALLDDARRFGIHMQTARMLAPLIASQWPSSETAVLAEAIVEVALAAGDMELARRWAETAANLQHWLTLAEIADPQSSGRQRAGLVHLTELSAQGRLPPEVLHRLATVLAALDIEVPIGLWEAAGRTPQPVTGYLPETGVLADLAQASRQKDAGRTILLAMRTFGANSADGANILALGDAVRALKRAGLEAEARRLGLEGLFTVWPRTTGQ